MKQIARYKIDFESKWILASTALMGFAFFCHVLYYFALTKPQDATGMDIAFFLVIPAVFELAWIILLRFMKWNAAGIYGILGALFCILLAVQVSITGGVWHIVLAWLGYLIASGLLLMITGGFFPYEYIGLAFFGLLFLIRFFQNGVIRLLRQRNWPELVSALPELFILAAILLFFGGISAVRHKK